LQQVATVSRHWWRAHEDAPTSPETVSARPRSRDAAQPTRRSQPSPRFELQIPNGDRRRPFRKRRARAASSFAAVILAAAAIAAAAVVAAPKTFDVSNAVEQAQSRAVSALMAAGFGIDQVSVVGHRFTADADVFDALDLHNVRAFWQLDADAALKRIERISWVDTAQLTRVYPGRLDVEIRERKPAATWARGERAYLVDATGRILAQTPSTHDWRLPRIAGEGANEDVGLLLTAVARHPELAAQIATSERVAERRWRINLTNGSRIELAAEREVEGLDQIAQSMELRKAIARGPVSIDVRTQGRIAVLALGQAHAAAQPQPSQRP
jgi:cell division protein FtsQ